MHVDHRRDRPHHLVADDRRVDRVDRVGDHGAGRHQGDHLVEEGQRVVLEHRAAAGPLMQLRDRLLAPLGEAEEERDHAGAEQQPFGGMRFDRAGAGGDAQDEEARERHHVDDHDLLQSEAVGHLGDAVADHHQADFPVDRGEGERDRARREQRRDRHRRALGELTRRERAEALLRVLAVELDVEQVVDVVAGAGDRAEGDEGEQRLDHLVRLVELAREEQAGEDEDVLDPLLRARGLQRRACGRAPRDDRFFWLSGGNGRVLRGDRFHRGSRGRVAVRWVDEW